MISKGQKGQRQDIAPTPEARQALGHIIHDINNSLMVIGITADQLERMVQDRAPASLKDSQDSAAPNVILRRNISHIRDMLSEVTQSFYDGDDAKHRFITMDCQDLHALLHNQVPEWSMILPESTQIEIEAISFEGGVNITPVYIMRLLQNLVRNAAEAYQNMPNPKDRLLITINSQVRDQQVHLMISDNGPGIDETIAAHIFNAHFTTKPNQLLPTGLGLAGARELAHIMNGRLALAPSPQAGSRFVLSLPLVTAQVPQKASAK